VDYALAVQKGFQIVLAIIIIMVFKRSPKYLKSAAWISVLSATVATIIFLINVDDLLDSAFANANVPADVDEKHFKI
jgi:hypothetical protein